MSGENNVPSHPGEYNRVHDIFMRIEGRTPRGTITGQQINNTPVDEQRRRARTWAENNLGQNPGQNQGRYNRIHDIRMQQPRSNGGKKRLKTNKKHKKLSQKYKNKKKSTRKRYYIYKK